jgi:hypothetical protein
MGLRLAHRNSYDEIVFHPDAISRFNGLGDTLRDRVRVVKKTSRGPATRYTPYPASKVGPEDVIGKVEMTDAHREGASTFG